MIINKNIKKIKIGIIGLGCVGNAVKYWFQKQECPLFLYDKYKKIGSLEEINKAEIIFICVPTPFEKKKGYDDGAVIESLNILSGSKIIVIKSTILPGSSEKFQISFPKHKIFFNPEFLKQKTSLKDFLNPSMQIIGYAHPMNEKIAKKVSAILPRSFNQKIIPSREAEMIKYFINSFLATRVIFANQIYDLCQTVGINYDLVSKIAGCDKRVGFSHFNVFHDGYRGYSGSCLPKDVKALIQFGKSNNLNLLLLKTINKINKVLLKE